MGRGAGAGRACGTEPCPGCYDLPERKGRPAYSFGACPWPKDEECREGRDVAHLLGDHRLCPDACEVMGRWRAAVVEAGLAACDEAGHTFAVVSVRSGCPVVHGTHERLPTAKPHRTAVGKRGRGHRWEAKTDTYVACASGHLH